MRKTLYSNKHMFIRYFMWRNANKMHFEHAKMVNFELMHCFLGYVQHKPIGLKILSPYHLGWLPGCVNFSLKNRRPGVFCDWIRESYFPPPKKKKFLEWIAQLPRYTTINLFEQMHIYIYIWCGLVDPCSKEWFTWRVTDRDTWSHGIHPTLFTGGLATSGQVELAQDVSFHQPKRVGFPSLKRTARPWKLVSWKTHFSGANC